MGQEHQAGLLMLALDRSFAAGAPVRSFFDRDGRLRVRSVPISKAGISKYLGNEIPGWRLLGLDGDREYRMLRHPDELRRAARSFRGVPLLREHAKLDLPHRPELVIGAVGSDAHFDGEYLRATVCVWSGSAIRGIEDGSARELSAGYRYEPPEMTPGRFRGERYDGIMRNLDAGHVALVESGRAGPDCAL
jgi:hypothetical protein